MTYSATVLADSPFAYYRLGDTTGSSTIADSSGGGHTGTNVGLPLGATGLLAGDSNTAANPTGASGQYALVTYGAFMDASTAFSVEAWIQPSSVTGIHAIVDRDQSGLRVFQFRLNGNKLEFIKTGGTGGVVTAASVTSLSIGSIYHVVATYDSSSILLYINASLDKTQAAAGNLGTGGSNLVIGGTYGGTTNPNSSRFAGTLDEPALYASVLSPTRIAAHYVAGTTTAISGSFAATLPTPVASFSGSYTPPPVTGSLAVTLPTPAAAINGTYSRPAGTLDVVLPTPTVAFTGTYAGSKQGSFAATLPVPAADFAGLYTPPPVSGSMDVTLPVPALSFTGLTAEASGTLAVDLPLPVAAFYGEYLGPYPTDTSNALDGLDLVCVGLVQPVVAVETPPSPLGVKYDKAIPYPTPTMVDGRPT